MINELGDKERGIIIIGGGSHALHMSMAELLLHKNLEHEVMILANTEGPGERKALTIDSLGESVKAIKDLENEKLMRMLDDLALPEKDEVFKIKAMPRFSDVTVLTDKMFNRFGYKPHPSKASDRKNFERNNKHRRK